MYIDSKKFTQLREASRNGDLKASEILRAFRDGGEHVSEMIEEYFKPQEEPVVEEEVKEEVPAELDRKEMSRLDKFLADNDITPDSPDYNEYVEEFNHMFPNEKAEVKKEEPKVEEPEVEEELSPEAEAFDMTKLIEDESEAIEGYDKKILAITNLQLEETIKLGIIAKLNEIKAEEINHLNALQELEGKLKNLHTEEEQL